MHILIRTGIDSMVVFTVWFMKNKDASMDHRVDTLTLVNALEHRNMFWRLTAQRLLVDGNRQDAVSKLLKLLDQPAPLFVMPCGRPWVGSFGF